MALSSLFYGMEAYLDGDIEINNNVTTPEEDAVAAADQSAEIASDAADANSEAKDNEVQAQMLVQMSKLYTHVKTYGIDRTFLSIYNANGELDKVCGVRFPSCESFAVTGNPRDQYSTRFIAAMEDDNKGFWNWIKNAFQRAWEWLKEKASWIWSKITDFWDWIKKQFKRLIDFFKRDKTPKNVGEDTKATVEANEEYVKTMQQAKVDKETIAKLSKELADALEKLKKAQTDTEAAQKNAEFLQKKIDTLNRLLDETKAQLQSAQEKAEKDKEEADKKIKQLEEERDKANNSASDAWQKFYAIKHKEEYDKLMASTDDRERAAKREYSKAIDLANQQLKQDQDEHYKKHPDKNYRPSRMQYQDDLYFASELARCLKTIDEWTATTKDDATKLRESIVWVLNSAKNIIDHGTLDDKKDNDDKSEDRDGSSMLTRMAAEVIRASARLENVLAIINNECFCGFRITKETLAKIQDELKAQSVDRFKTASGKLIDSTAKALPLYQNNKGAAFPDWLGKDAIDYSNSHKS